MPDHEELEFRTADFLDRQDTERRKARLMPWGRHLEPTPETDAEEELRLLKNLLIGQYTVRAE